MISRFSKFLLPVLFLLLVSCAKSLEDEKVAEQNAAIERFLSEGSYTYQKANGVYYAVDSLAYGYKVALGDTLKFWYVAKTLVGNRVFDTNIKPVALANRLDSTFRTFEPITGIAGKDNFIEGLRRGLLMARGKQKGKVLFASNLGFGNNELGPVPAWSALIYDIQIVSVSNAAIRAEATIIQNYLASTAMGFNFDAAGYWMHVATHGNGSPVSGSSQGVNIWYRVTKLSGEPVYQTTGSSELVSLSPEQTMLGLTLSLTKLKVGDVAFILLPSPLTSGPREYDKQHPYTPLLCEVRIESLKVN